MKSLKPTTIAAGAVLAIAFVGGVVFGPSITAEVAASGPGGAYEALANNGFHGDDLFSATADLRTKLQGGQTLAQIANATSGKSRDGLVKALVDDATAKIDAAQKAGTITADQATQLKANLQQRTTNLVDHAGPGPRR